MAGHVELKAGRGGRVQGGQRVEMEGDKQLKRRQRRHSLILLRVGDWGVTTLTTAMGD